MLRRPLLALTAAALPLALAACQSARPDGAPTITSAQVATPAPAPKPTVTAEVSPGPGDNVPPPIAQLRTTHAERLGRPAGEVFENVQTFRAVTAGELLDVMAGFNRSLGVSCSACHVRGNWASDDKHEKAIARHMAEMTAGLNHEMNVASGVVAQRVTCWTCHNGATKPEVKPGS